MNNNQILALWRFIFIVPPGMALTFTSQAFERDTDMGAWVGKLNQYVLRLEVGSV